MKRLALAVFVTLFAVRADAAPTWPADTLRACAASVSLGHEASDDAQALRVCARVGVAAHRHGLPVDLLVAVARVESHYRPGVVSADRCVGPLQVKARYHCPRKLGGLRWCTYDEAVAAGAAYLAGLVGRYGERGGLARYRVGESAYRSPRWRAVGQRYAGRVLAGGG